MRFRFGLLLLLLMLFKIYGVEVGRLCLWGWGVGVVGVSRWYGAYLIS